MVIYKTQQNKVEFRYLSSSQEDKAPLHGGALDSLWIIVGQCRTLHSWCSVSFKMIKQCLILGSALVVLLFSVSSYGQIPSFGGCAEYQPMTGFERENFMGTWYEQERYFTFSELAGKCISATYERRVDGRIYVNNTVVNRL